MTVYEVFYSSIKHTGTSGIRVEVKNRGKELFGASSKLQNLQKIRSKGVFPSVSAFITYRQIIKMSKVCINKSIISRK